MLEISMIDLDKQEFEITRNNKLATNNAERLSHKIIIDGKLVSGNLDGNYSGYQSF